jgi:CO dehydrogenase maturation factor
MAFTLAVAGKGGTGKTTVAALSVLHVARAASKPILAVDADPNATLGEALGVEPPESLVSILDQTHGRENVPSGMTRDRYIELQLHEAVFEAPGYDLLVMGRPEGPGCYCQANNILRGMIEKLSRSYEHMIIDNEAGMEHLSRRTARRADLLLLVLEPTRVGVRTAQRILQLIRDLKIDVSKTALVVNKTPADALDDDGRITNARLAADLDALDHDETIALPYDADIVRLSMDGEPLTALPDGHPAARWLARGIDRLADIH